MSTDNWTVVVVVTCTAVIAATQWAYIQWSSNRTIDAMHRSQGRWHIRAECDWCQKRGLG